MSLKNFLLLVPLLIIICLNQGFSEERVCPRDYLENCTSCSKGYGITFNKECKKCTDSCAICNYNTSSCSYCIDSTYGPIPGSPACQKCDDPNCESCYPTYMTCDSCKEGYGTIPHGTLGGLLECKSEIKSKCVDPNCKICMEANKCTECEDKYKLINGDCRGFSEERVCPRDYLVNCTSCSKGYGITVDKECLKCNDSCAICNYKTSSCSYCIDSTYGPIPGSPGCQKCDDPNCESCYPTYKTCDSCKEGFGTIPHGTLGGVFECKKCVDSNCKICTQANKCIECELKYKLINGDCREITTTTSTTTTTTTPTTTTTTSTTSTTPTTPQLTSTITTSSSTPTRTSPDSNKATSATIKVTEPSNILIILLLIKIINLNNLMFKLF